MHTDEFVHVSSNIGVFMYSYVSVSQYIVNTCISGNLCVCVHVCVYCCVCVPLFSALQMLIYGFFQTFVFLIYFTSKGHMESWGHSSIWALIEGETDKQRDKEKERERERKCVCVCVWCVCVVCVCECVCVCVCACVCVCVCVEGAGIQSTSVH